MEDFTVSRERFDCQFLLLKVDYDLPILPVYRPASHSRESICLSYLSRLWVKSYQPIKSDTDDLLHSRKKRIMFIFCDIIIEQF